MANVVGEAFELPVATQHVQVGVGDGAEGLVLTASAHTSNRFNDRNSRAEGGQ
jgi:hypothetical protein